MMNGLPASRSVVALLGVSVALMMGCVEAPFERVNANDSTVDFTMSIVASRDTVNSNNSLVYLQVVTDPVQTGYTPLWTVSDPAIVTHLGGGVFRVVPGAVPSVVSMTASFRERSATKTIVRVP